MVLNEEPESEKYKAIFEGADDGILVADIKTKKFILANPRICKITGYPLKELLKLDVNKIHPKKDLHYVLDQFKKQAQGKITLAKNIPVLRKDKKVIYCNVDSATIKIGKKKFLVGFFEDITGQKKIEEELRDSEEKFRNLFEYAPDAYYLNDLKGNFIDGNIVSEKLTGYKRDKLIGESFLKLKLIPPRQIPRAAALLTKNMLGQPTGPDEFTLIRKDGTKVETEIRTIPIKLKGKTLVLGIAHDITRRKITEEALKKSQEELNKTNQELQSKVEELERFNRLAVGRELKMIELKNRIKELEEKTQKNK